MNQKESSMEINTMQNSLKVERGIIDRRRSPLTSEIEKITIQQVKRQTLDNGIPLYSISAGFQDVIRVEFIFPNPQFNSQNPLLTTSTNRLLSEGTTKHTAHQLAEMVDFYGSFYETD